MNTATKTLDNVIDVSPVISITREATNGRVAVFATADYFIDANIRHVVNRRMRWNGFADKFVRADFEARAAMVTNDSAVRSSTILAYIEDAVDLVRDAANRRKAWNLVETTILLATERLIRACS